MALLLLLLLSTKLKVVNTSWILHQEERWEEMLNWTSSPKGAHNN